MNYKELQKAVYAALNVQSLTTLLGGPKIYDRVPAAVKPQYPYITFGTPVQRSEHGHQSLWANVLFQVDVWHRDSAIATGKATVYDIQAEVRSLLDREYLNISGATHLYTQEETSTILDGDDGITWHGVQVFAIGAAPTS
jgi:hypothetical protein